MTRRGIGYPLPRRERYPRLAAFGEWFLLDFLGEMVLGIAALALTTWAWAAFTNGWEHHRGATIVSAGLFAAFLAYGVWAVFADLNGRRPRWPRLAFAGALTFSILAWYSIYLL